MKNIQPKFIVVLTAIVVASVFRLLPHWPNFTPIATIALLGGSMISNRFLSFAVPVIAMVISDFLTIQLINFRFITPAEYFSSLGTAFIYLGVVAMVAIGFFLRKSRSISSLAVASLATAVIFFLLSNLGVWMNNPLPKTMGGLLATYEMGIPFFAYNLAGNLLFTFLFFGAIQYVSSKRPELIRAYVK